MRMINEKTTEKLVDYLNEIEDMLPEFTYGVVECVNDIGEALCGEELMHEDGELIPISKHPQLSGDAISRMDEALEKYGVYSDDARMEYIREIMDSIYDLDVDELFED